MNTRIKLIFSGAFLSDHYDKSSENFMLFYLSKVSNGGKVQNLTDIFKIPISASLEIDNVKEIKRSKTIYLNHSDFLTLQQNTTILKLNLLTKLRSSFALNFSYDPSPLNKDIGIILAATVLLGLYVLIIWELVHRTLAAMIASTLAIGLMNY